MAKKAVGKVKGTTAKSKAQIIIPKRSAKTGAYTFQSFVVATEEVPKYIANYKQ